LNAVPLSGCGVIDRITTADAQYESKQINYVRKCVWNQLSPRNWKEYN